jgi:hypothetical protein
MPGIKESGGRRISETKLVTTLVNAAAILGVVRNLAADSLMVDLG